MSKITPLYQELISVAEQFEEGAKHETEMAALKQKQAGEHALSAIAATKRAADYRRLAAENKPAE